ncbi:MAG: efflux RND transporter periplasmic adaptor subunit [Akkermansiaceae bacterium]|nr:efflux RND transporter periplasmic adaptor subunit [Akkermansiaceae bacterium]
MRLLFHILVPLAILAVGCAAFFGLKGVKSMTLFGREIGPELNEKPARSQAGSKRPMLRTKAIALKRQDHTVLLQTQGEVRTHNATSLTAQISGKIIRISEHFEDGAFFAKDDILLELDPADYQTELTSAQAQLARAEASFAQEKARAKQALLNWKDAGFSEEPSELVLRKPQLREAEATVNSAKSSVERAERNLARTKIRAPYDGRVRKRHVGLGQQVGGGTTLGEIFSTDFAEVRLPLTTRDLNYFTPPQKPGEQGEQDQVTFNSILTEQETGASPAWRGTIVRAEGELDEGSRQLFVIARIDDPFSLNSDTPPLYIGQPVRATIPGKKLNNVYVVRREHMSGLNELLLVRGGTLTRISVNPVWSGQEVVIIRDGIEPDDLIATSHLPYAPEGAPVEIISEGKVDAANKSSQGGGQRTHGTHSMR